MKDKPLTCSSPGTDLENLRERLLGGGTLLVEDLNDEALAAMNELLLEGQAEIISSACRPYLAAKLDKTII